MLSWLSYLLADALSRILPARMADGLAVALARTAFAARVPARAHLERNLALLLGVADPTEVEGTARRGFESFAVGLADFLRLRRTPAGSLAAAMEVHGEEHLARARRSERGVILLSVHLGSWELGAAWLASLGRPVRLVARPHPSRWVERFYACRRESWGVGQLSARPLWRHAAAALRRREWVALMVDRPVSAHPETGRGSVCAWAAALSRRTGAVVLPAVIVRLPGRRYAACFDRPVEPDEVRADGFLDALRARVRSHPGQWAAFEPLPEGLA